MRKPLPKSRGGWNISVSCHPLIGVGRSCWRLLDLWESGVAPIPEKASEISQVFFLDISFSSSGCLLILSTRIDKKEKVAYFLFMDKF